MTVSTGLLLGAFGATHRWAALLLADQEEAEARVRFVAGDEADAWLAIARREDAAWRAWAMTVPFPGDVRLRGHRAVYDAITRGLPIEGFRGGAPAVGETA